MAPIRESDRRPEGHLWRAFERARPAILGALLDVSAHGLENRSRVRAQTLPRMADFALWAAACETALWPAGTVAHAYAANRRAAIEGVIEADPVAACVREMMAEPVSGAAPRQIFCVPPINCSGRRSRSAAQTGRATRARSPVAYDGPRHRCGPSASTLHSIVRGAPAVGSSRCAQPQTVPSAPAAL